MKRDWYDDLPPYRRAQPDFAIGAIGLVQAASALLVAAGTFAWWLWRTAYRLVVRR